MASRKDYIAMAEILSRCKPKTDQALQTSPLDVWCDIVSAISDMYFTDNHNFDYARFYKASEYED